MGLGSNLGDRAAAIRGAVTALGRVPGIRILRRSRLRRTAAVGPPQPDFLNGVVLLDTELSPEALLGVLLGIEAALGRVRRARHGPRRIDLDLLVHGPARRRTRALALPHPRMHTRAFVMRPLAEIAPALRVPGRGTAGRIWERLARG